MAGKATAARVSAGRASAGKRSGKRSSKKAMSDAAMAGSAMAGSAMADGAKFSESVRPGSERARDEQRDEPTPRYGGGQWSVADERGDARFGHARNDDADPPELAAAEADNDDDEAPDPADPELRDAEPADDEPVGEIESSGQRAGMGRGEAPRKNKQREP
ncbi:MAG TPA: hypothetical protein VK607_19900 [Kofleriaceae bacterium]|nr:hypothetical protein [Kofleriaceae bacterium]